MRLLRPFLLVLALLGLAGCPSDDDDCPAGLSRCFGQCVDVTSHPANCGACGARCASGASCTAGRCACPAGQVVCGGACVDLQTDGINCGACGVSCGQGTCTGGACVCDAGAGATPCPTPGGDQCADLQNDPSNCGACRASCRANEPCVDGVCRCLAPNLLCPPEGGPAAACVLAATDERNCGACGNVCPLANDVCVSGTCRCPASLPDACPGTPGRCVDRDADEANCGACGNACAPGTTCVAGACAGPTCSDPTPIACGGSCCAGTRCCDGPACQTEHSNGLGGTWFDCVAPGTHDAIQAASAAESWSPTGETTPGGPGGFANCPSTECLCRTSPASFSSAVWCWGNPAPGRVLVFPGAVSCLQVPSCATLASPTWN